MEDMFLPDISKGRVEEYLLFKQKQIESQLVSLEQDDPVLVEDEAGSDEWATDAWKADVHAKNVVVKSSIMDLSAKIKESLKRLKLGTYGLCEKCGRKINPERLAALPTAKNCLCCI